MSLITSLKGIVGDAANGATKIKKQGNHKNDYGEVKTNITHPTRKQLKVTLEDREDKPKKQYTPPQEEIDAFHRDATKILAGLEKELNVSATMEKIQEIDGPKKCTTIIETLIRANLLSFTKADLKRFAVAYPVLKDMNVYVLTEKYPYLTVAGRKNRSIIYQINPELLVYTQLSTRSPLPPAETEEVDNFIASDEGYDILPEPEIQVKTEKKEITQENTTKNDLNKVMKEISDVKDLLHTLEIEVIGQKEEAPREVLNEILRIQTELEQINSFYTLDKRADTGDDVYDLRNKFSIELSALRNTDHPFARVTEDYLKLFIKEANYHIEAENKLIELSRILWNAFNQKHIIDEKTLDKLEEGHEILFEEHDPINIKADLEGEGEYDEED